MDYDDDKEAADGVGISDDALLDLEDDVADDEDEDDLLADADHEEKDWE